MTARMCDGQPSQPCKSGCVVDCDFNVREAAHTKAAEQHFSPELKVQMFDKPSRLNRCLDWVGNLPYRIELWWDDLNELGRISSVVGLIAVCAGLAVAAVEAMT